MNASRALGVAVPLAFFASVGVFVWTADGRSSSPADRAIVRANVSHDLPPEARRIGARLGGKVELAAADQESTEAMPGEETKVTLLWRSLARLAGAHRVFAHLIGPDGSRVNLDHNPVYGLYPIAQWRPGEIVRDEVWITFAGRAARGEHVLWVGVYDEAGSQERLEVEAPGDAIVDGDGSGSVRAAAWQLR